MTPTEEIAKLQRYIELHHGIDAELGRMPEKTMAGLLNLVSPEARSIIKQNQSLVRDFKDSGGRSAPFQPKRYLDDLDIPAHAQAAMAKSDGEDIVRGIHERMGTPTASAPNNSAPDMRETLTAAFDMNEGSDHD